MSEAEKFLNSICDGQGSDVSDDEDDETKVLWHLKKAKKRTLTTLLMMIGHCHYWHSKAALSGDMKPVLRRAAPYQLRKQVCVCPN